MAIGQRPSTLAVELFYSETRACSSESRVDIYKIFVYFEAIVHESTILSFPPPTCIAHPGAILLHDDWTV